MKHYLDFIDMQGREVYIAAEDIIAIFNAGQDTCSIVCGGLPGPIIVKQSHKEVFKQLENKKMGKWIGPTAPL